MAEPLLLGFALFLFLAFLALGRLGLDGARGDDGRDREVTILDHRLNAFGQLHMADVQAVADVGLQDVDLDEVRNGVGWALQLHVMTNDVQHTTAAQTHGILFIEELYRDRDVDPRRRGNAQEIDVQRLVLDRVHLHIAGQYRLLLLAGLDLEDAGEEAGPVQLALHDPHFDADRGGILAVAVDHGRHQAGATCGAGGPLSGPLPQFRGNRNSIFHLLSKLQLEFTKPADHAPAAGMAAPASRGAGARRRPPQFEVGMSKRLETECSSLIRRMASPSRGAIVSCRMFWATRMASVC